MKKLKLLRKNLIWSRLSYSFYSYKCSLLIRSISIKQRVTLMRCG